MKVRSVLWVAAAAAALAGCSGANGASSSSVAHVGQPAPNWTEPTASGGKLTLASLRGKAVYLNFFATWCPPCNEEAPYVNSLQKQFGPQGVQIVGVDELENAKQALEFKKKYGLVYPEVVDGGALQSQYNVNGLPVHVFIDRSGVVRRIFVGQMSRADITSELRTLLQD